MHSMTSYAGTEVALRESFAGNLSFALTGGSFRTTQNNQSACALSSSSSNPLSTLPATATIKTAYLYWAASSSNSTFVDNAVTFNNQTVFADRTYTDSSGSSYYYSGVANVTNIVSASRNGIYTLSNLSIFSNSTRCSNQTVLGGWSLAVIYEDDTNDFSVLNVYEGFQYFQRDAAVSSLVLTPSNFKLPSNPKGQHAHITWEGDDTIGNDGEGLRFEGNDLFDTSGGNFLGNQFDSYSNIEGGLTTYGVDIDSYDVSPYLTEGATSVSTTYSTRQDGVLLSAEIISVSNIPVADLAVTTSAPTSWQQGSTITKKFTVSNNGPNDIPAQSARFTTTLPPQLSFDGNQSSSNWNCTQNGQQLSCVYQPKLRSGWSDYLDIRFNVAPSTAGQTINWPVNVDHDIAPYDVFDNHEENNLFTLNVPISANAVVDLSASSKTPNNLNGDLLLAGDTLQYVITLDDASNLAINGIQVQDSLPANISGYTITALPSGAVDNSSTTGGTNGTGFLDVNNISLPADGTAEIIFEVYVNANAPEGASLQNQADIFYNSNSWLVDTGDITVVEPDLSPSNKTAEDLNGGWLLPEETLRYTIIIEEENNLELTNLQVTDNLPAHISAFNIVSLPSGATDFSTPTGGTNNTGFIDIRNINLLNGQTASIIIDAVIDKDVPDQTSMINSANIIINSQLITVTSDDIIININNNTPASGNKPLYLVNNDLTRVLPSSDTSRSFNHGDTITWAIAPLLQDDLDLDNQDIRLNLAVEGHRTGSVQTRFFVTLYYNDNVGGGNTTITSGTIPYANYRINTLYDAVIDMPLAAEITIPEGSTIFLAIENQSSNNRNNRYAEIDIHSIHNGFYSSVVLPAKTVINVDQISVWDAAFTDNNGDYTDDSGAQVVASSEPDTQLSIRATVSDPFGAFDINRAEITLQKSNGTSYDFAGNNVMQAIDSPADDFSSNQKVFEKLITLQEENEITGFWTISITAFEGSENDVDHTNISTVQIIPFMPNIALNKTIEVINDPINGPLSAGNKPKAIPGAELKYTIHALNSGRGQSDSDSIVLQDEIPANSELYISDITCLNRGPGTGSGPICFEDGASPNESQLTFDFLGLTAANDDIFFSQDGADFSYEPIDSGDGYDPNIRYIRISPSGIYKSAKKDGSETPEFNFSYQVRLQ